MRRRIVGLSVLTGVLATVLFGVPLGYLVAQYLLGGERGEVERVADTVAIAVSADLLRGQAPVTFDPVRDDISVGLYARDGARLAGLGPAHADAVVRRAGDGRVASDDDDHGELVVAVPVTDGSSVTGVVRAESDYSAVRRSIVEAWAVMLGLAVASIGAAWLLARRQARRLATPLESLAAAAEQLGSGDFSVRARPTGTPEIDAAAEALNRTAGRLGDLVARERAFSADASHQLRTPLTGLRLRLETALDLPAAEHRAAMTAAIAAADRLEQIVSDLLALARDAGPHGTVLPVPELLAELTETWQPVLAAQDRQLRVVRDPVLPDSRASSAAVRQVVGVLLENAVTHGAGTVTLAVRDAGEALAVDVSDEGLGLTDTSALFQRRADGARGHGIGLALARGLAEGEGGRLLLARQSPPVFTLLLPAEPDPC